MRALRRGPRNSRFVTVLFLFVFVVASAAMLRLLAVFASAILLALVLASLAAPAFDRILVAVRGRRRAAAGLTTALVVVLVIVPLSLVLSSLTAETVDLYQRLASGRQPLLHEVMELLASDHPLVVKARALGAAAGMDLSPEGLRSYASDVGATAAGLVVEQLRGLASNAFRIVMTFGLTLVILFAVLLEGPRLRTYLWDLSPLPQAQEDMLAQRFAGISRAVFLGNGVASTLQGLLGGLGFVMFGLGSGVLWGAAIAFFAFLPIVGASVIFLPAAGVLALRGEVGLAAGFIAYNAVYVGLLEYGLKPRLIGGQSQMNGVLVFVGILSGLSLFGILGLFYGPLILTMFLTLAEIYKAEYRDDLMALQSPWVGADLGQVAVQEPGHAPPVEAPSSAPVSEDEEAPRPPTEETPASSVSTR